MGSSKNWSKSLWFILDQFPVLKMPWFVLDVQLQDLTWTIMLIRWTLPPVAPYTNMV